jgi:hypothetical protein
VIREALARRSASIMMNISMRCWLAGGLVDWMTNTSVPRTFSSILTKVSPLGNGFTVEQPKGIPMESQIALARLGLELPVKTFTDLSDKAECNRYRRRFGPPKAHGVGLPIASAFSVGAQLLVRTDA